MITVAQHIDGGAVKSEGRSVIAWGYGRMRHGVILNVGRKNVKLELVQNTGGDTYVKSVPLGEVFLVPETEGAERIANLINNAALRGRGARRRAVDYDTAKDLAAMFGEAATSP